MQYETYLAHHGVKGMKWGRRKDRYYDRQSAYRRSKRMSDDDIVSANTRMNKERKYRQNIKEEYMANRSTASAFVDSGKSIMNDAQTSTNAGANIARTLGDRKRASNTSFAAEAKSMSDAELRSVLNRMDMERRYVALKQSEVTTGYDRAASILNASGYVLASAAGVLGVATTLKYLRHSELYKEVIMGNELYHHGIKGMHWGVRRYQKSDGSLTSQGREKQKRYTNTQAQGYRKASLYTQKRDIKKLKAARKARDKSIQDTYDRTISKIESSYKRGQNLSDKDLSLESKADRKAMQDWANSKAQYKSDKAKIKLQGSINRGEKLVAANQNYGKIVVKGLAKQAATNLGASVLAGMANSQGLSGASHMISAAATPVRIIMAVNDVRRISEIHAYRANQLNRR